MTRRPTALLADIGGTHARFALLDSDAQVNEAWTVTSADYPDFITAAEKYLEHAKPHIRPTRAAFACAGPLTDDHVTLTNRHTWSIQRDEVAQALSLDDVLIVNDFAAIAHGIPRLGSSYCRQIGGGAAVEGAAVGVIGPGSGLGVSGLIPVETVSGRHWAVLASEGGHITASGINEEEDQILRILRRRWNHVSAERLLSGMGLQNILTALYELAGESLANDPFMPEISAAEITAAGLSGRDPRCQKAIDLFSSFLGNVAGDLALTLGARGGVYIAGGIVPRFGPAFDKTPFRQNFEYKGRMASYVANIPTFVITHPHPAFIGLAACLTHSGLTQH